MSSPNWSVGMSSQGDMGDRHDESEGGRPAGPDPGDAGREDHHRGRCPRPGGEPPAVPPPQSAVSPRRDPGSASSPPGAPLAAGAGARGAESGGRTDPDDLSRAQ